MSILSNNTTSLQSLLDTVNALPEAGSGGVELPELTTPASASEVHEGYEYIDASGEKQTGTFTLDEEISTQDDLISQIQTALANKTSASPTLQSKTVTPSTSSQAVTPDSGYDGLSSVVVNGDANLVAENIAEGISIFGVSGTHSGSSGGTFSVVNNLLHPMIVNGYECAVGQTISIPHNDSDIILFLILCDADSETFDAIIRQYVDIQEDSDEFGIKELYPIFGSYCEEFYDGETWEESYMSMCTITPSSYTGTYNISGLYPHVPYDYDNDIPLDGGTVIFQIQ